MSEKKTKLAVLFPGVNYTVDCPLLYSADFSFKAKGYEIVNISYGHIRKDDTVTFEEITNRVAREASEQLKEYQGLNYEDIVFVSKSFGTVIAGLVEERLNLGARHIFLTPVKYTLPFMKKGNTIAIAGTEDSQLEAGVLYEHCHKEDIMLVQFEGVGHRLEYKNNLTESIAVLKKVIEYYK